MNVFISPLHQEKLSSVLGNQINEHSVCLPLAIDLNVFKSLKDVKRQKGTVLIPTFRKCGQNALNYINTNADKKYFVIGQIASGIKKGVSIEGIPPVNNDEMAKLYNTYEEMLHIPVSFWAGERIYFEALLCGCKPIVNDNVGHTSWKFTKNTLKNKLKQAPFTFWKEVENVIKNRC